MVYAKLIKKKAITNPTVPADNSNTTWESILSGMIIIQFILSLMRGTTENL